MIVDANVLVYAVDTSSPHHARAAAWLTEALNGTIRVGLPWQTIGAFLRITTHPRLWERPLTADDARHYIDTWLATPVAWMPSTDASTWEGYRELVADRSITGNLVPDAQLAALAVQHGVELVSADSDFARFPRVRWVNPLG